MELKYIIPIVLGWILSQLSGAFSLAREDRRYRSASLPAMMELYFQQYRINKILEFFNLRLGDSLEQISKVVESGGVKKEDQKKTLGQLMASFEVNRQGIIDLPEKNKDTLFESLDSSVKSLSKIDPASAYRLFRFSSEFALLLEIKFPPERLDPKSYIETQINLLSIFRRDIKELRSLIIKTAFRTGLVVCIQVFLLIRSEEKQISSTPPDVIEEVIRSTKPNK